MFWIPPTALLMLLIATAGAVAPRYFAAGVSHIVPGGPDHILFILALFFLNRSVGVLLVQMTLFTLGHSLTLGLSLLGLVTAPDRWVEIAIALSIVLVAGENLFSESPGRWRPWLVFASGLVHGLGLAHAFGGEGLAGDDFLVAMFGFNLGIECGQLAVVGLAAAGVGAWWRSADYRRRIARPASALIAASGVMWLVERSVG